MWFVRSQDYLIVFDAQEFERGGVDLVDGDLKQPLLGVGVAAVVASA